MKDLEYIPNQNAMQDFHFFINNCSCNGQEGGSCKWARLDRVLYSTKGLHVFPITKVEHLSRTLSDHSPLLVTFQTNLGAGPRPFRFQEMWTRHPSFKEVVYNS